MRVGSESESKRNTQHGEGKVTEIDETGYHPPTFVRTAEYIATVPVLMPGVYSLTKLS